MQIFETQSHLSRNCLGYSTNGVWKIWGVWKLLIRDHGTMKLALCCVLCTNPFVNLLVLPSVTREYELGLLDLLQCIAVCLQRRLTGVDFYSGLIARSWKPINACGRPCSEDASSTKPSAEINVWSCTFQQWHPRQLDCFSYRHWGGGSNYITFLSATPTVNGCDLTPPRRTQPYE